MPLKRFRIVSVLAFVGIVVSLCVGKNSAAQETVTIIKNELAKDFYSQCYSVWRYENPPGPQGDPLNEPSAASVAREAVLSRLGLGGQDVVSEISLDSGERVLFVGYLASFDPNTQSTEFANQLNQAMFASVDAFVRADTAPLYLVVQAFAFIDGEAVLVGSRTVHRTDAVDWWNGSMSDGAFIGKWQ